MVALARCRLRRLCLAGARRPTSEAAGTNTNRRAKVHKKQQLMTPSFRFPLRAGGTELLRGSPREAGGGTEPLRGSPREAGGTYGGGQL
jgi:hypothetical protein